MNKRILVVDDEPDTVELVRFNLHGAGFDVLAAADGAEALRKARASTPDLIVLDLMLPEIGGLDVCKLLRRDPFTAEVPILMLTAKTAELDRVLGLELGADDYVTKPFSPRELVLRIKKLLDRRQELAASGEAYRVGPLFLDVPRHLVTVQGQPVKLTATEFKLLTLLLQRRGRVQTREQLLRDVWEYENVMETRTADTHVRRLRKKLGVAAKGAERRSSQSASPAPVHPAGPLGSWRQDLQNGGNAGAQGPERHPQQTWLAAALQTAARVGAWAL
jgi:two-component system phosphate regulon response regulator PhoB